MSISAVPAPSNSVALPGADIWASRFDRKGSTSSDDACTSAGAATPSELVSMSAGSTPRLLWSDIVDDCTLADDLVGEAEDSVVVGADVNAAAPTKSSRRRRCRGKRGNLAVGNAIKRADEPQVMNNVIKTDALGTTDIRDRATQTLADLGLLVSTPGSATPSKDPPSPGKALVAQGEIMSAAHLHSRLPHLVHSREAAEASCPQHSFVSATAYPYYVAQPTLAPQPMPTMCAVVPTQSQFYR